MQKTKVDMTKRNELKGIAQPKNDHRLTRPRDSYIHASGSVQNDKGTWVIRARVYVPWLGKYIQPSHSTKLKVKDHTKRKAEKMKQQYLQELEEWVNSGNAHTDPTLSDYIQIFLDKKRVSVRKNTIGSYEIYAKRLINDIGYMHIRDLTTSKIQSYYNELFSEMKSQSVKKYNVVVKGAIDCAIHDGIIQTNCTEYIEYPKEEEFERRICSIEELDILLEKAKETDEFYFIVGMLGGCYGLRREEILGLRWKDIDFNSGFMHIRNTVVQSDKEIIEEERTKSRSSKRYMLLLDKTIPYLMDLKQRQIDAGLKLDKVCVFSNGKQIQPHSVTAKFSEIADSCGLDGVTIHSLRHTASTLLSGHASPKQIQDFLGHNDVETKLNVYTHEKKEDKILTSKIMNDIIQKINCF